MRRESDIELGVMRTRRAQIVGLDRFFAVARHRGSGLLALRGESGTGKTALAVTWLNLTRDRHGCALLAVNCGGERGRSASAVCDAVFTELGVDPQERGAVTESARLELFRRLVSVPEHQTLLLLDDVRTVEQVAPFLDVPGLIVLVTTTDRGQEVSGPGWHTVDVEPLSEPETAELLRLQVRRNPWRLDAEPVHYAHLLSLAGGLPCHVTRLASALDQESFAPVGDFVDDLVARKRAGFLSGEPPSGAATERLFESAYERLSHDARHLYRALGEHEVAHFDRWLLHSLFRDAPDLGARALRELLVLSFLTWDPWTQHYVVDRATHRHARTKVRGPGMAGERKVARRRIRDYYLFGAVLADRMTTHRAHLGLVYRQKVPFTEPVLRAPDEASTDLSGWFERFRARWVRGRYVPRDDVPTPAEWVGRNIEMIIHLAHLRDGAAWQLALATNGYFTAHGREDLRVIVLAAGLAEARELGYRDAVARILVQYAEMALGSGRLGEARQHARSALAIARTAETDPWGRAAALEWLAIIELRFGRATEAERYLLASWPFLRHRRPRTVALHYMHKGDIDAQRGDLDAAREHYRISSEQFQAHTEQEGRPDHANLGKLRQKRARLADDAGLRRQCLEQALAHFVAADRPQQIAATLTELSGQCNKYVGVRYLALALEICGRIGWDEEADRIRALLVALRTENP